MTTFLSLWFLKKGWRSICFSTMTITIQYVIILTIYLWQSLPIVFIILSWLCLIILFITLKITLIEYKLSVTVFLLQKHHHRFSGEGGAGGGGGGNLVCWVFNCFFLFFFFTEKINLTIRKWCYYHFNHQHSNLSYLIFEFLPCIRYYNDNI